tara:strand:+ start:46 stop:216 length:171 start_codon:yes stop_codon:yes gene_type:complete
MKNNTVLILIIVFLLFRKQTVMQNSNGYSQRIAALEKGLAGVQVDLISLYETFPLA